MVPTVIVPPARTFTVPVDEPEFPEPGDIFAFVTDNTPPTFHVTLLPESCDMVPKFVILAPVGTVNAPFARSIVPVSADEVPVNVSVLDACL
jgi:hypothetical protein